MRLISSIAILRIGMAFKFGRVNIVFSKPETVPILSFKYATINLITPGFGPAE